MGNLFQVFLVQPILNILVAIYVGLVSLHIPYALGFSIIGLTIFIRLILWPLTASQMRTSRKMQQLTPHLNRLREKHKGDNQRLQAETMALYKEHGVNPAAGCLPMIIQLPVIWALYSVLQHVVTIKLSDINHQIYFPLLHLSHIWDTSFFGVNLGASPAKLLPHLGVLVFLIPAFTALLQFVQTKMMFAKPTTENLAMAEKGKQEKKDTASDFASAFQSQSMYVFPVMIGFLSYTFPLGLSLYWNTFTIFGIIQQYQLSGLGSLEGLLPFGRKTTLTEEVSPKKLAREVKPRKQTKKKKGLHGR